MTHIINKQVIELILPDGKNAFHVQHLISTHYQDELVPLLEKTFNNYYEEDEIVIVPKLEIDLGIISVRDLEKGRLDDRFLHIFRDRLVESLVTFGLTKTIVRRTKRENHCMQWIEYMKQGYLPWNVLEINDNWHDNVLETLATNYTAVAQLRTMIAEKPEVAYRIALQHEAVFLRKISEILTAEKQELLPVVVDEMYSMSRLIPEYGIATLMPAELTVKRLWQQILIAAATGGKNFSTESLVALAVRPWSGIFSALHQRQKLLSHQTNLMKEILRRQFEGDVATLGNMPSQTEGEQIEQPFADSLPFDDIRNNSMGGGDDPQDANVSPALAKPEVRVTVKNVDITDETTKNEIYDHGTNVDAVNKEKVLNQTKDINDNDDIPGSMEESFNSDIQEQKLKEKEPALFSLEDALESKNENTAALLSETIPAEGIFVLHAGLVLTHPFLPFLFRRLQWLNGNHFLNEEAHVKAVFMLHYLATGHTKAPEHELVFCKLLGAYPISEPLPLEIQFEKEETDEATEMLLALIQQWNKLQNTSVAGIREGFLQRKGKLVIKNEQPSIIMEKSSIDVLLDFLPWNISFVKVPWMKTLLKVEWR